MDKSLAVLSSLTTYLKYSRYLTDKKRRETWDEIVNRNRDMHLKKFPNLKNEIDIAFELVRAKRILPSMRAMQFAGKPIEIIQSRIYNCSYIPIDDWQAFHEVMFLLLGGSGVGYSVQRHHIAKLPEIKGPTKRSKRYVIQDSIAGWSDAVKVLMRSYFFGESNINFDFSDIRAKGTLLKTSGGRAPGPQPLKDCIHNLRKILDTKQAGDKLTSIEVHDMICFIADAVLAGGIRRAALISLFSFDDEDMLTAKSGTWYELNPQRGRANNSAVVIRHKIKKAQFLSLWERIEKSGAGEPGIFFSNDQNWGLNPCAEVSLRPNQFCNLCTINASLITSQVDLNECAKAATLIGTLQASYTDFNYLRDIWVETTEKEALLGISITGIASGTLANLDLEEAAQYIKSENKRVTKIIKINPAARATVIKPEGTSSLVLGTSSGCHPWHSKYYIRRITILKNEPIYSYLKEKLPALIEDDFEKPSLQAKVSIPVKAPDKAVFRTESPIKLLERVKKLNQEWIVPGHTKGDNTNNVSATVSVKPDEWEEVGEWMWRNRDYYNCISVLPFDGGTYKQAPYEECTEAEYKKLAKHVESIDLSEIVEDIDNTALQDQLACAGGSCDIK